MVTYSNRDHGDEMIATARPSHRTQVASHHTVIFLRRKETISYTQGELCEFCQRLTAGTGLAAHRSLHVSEYGTAFLLTNTDAEQTLMLSSVLPYYDKGNNRVSICVCYTRKHLDKEGNWGAWERRT